ncbi:MAG TPA: hypothetical protein DD640_04805, partial [Clostridiales bacterium]|nr:hypothetical protein [Clostridiales bacterium]
MRSTAVPQLPGLPYPITIQRGSAYRIPEIFRERLAGRRLVVVSDREVSALYRQTLNEQFKAGGANPCFLTIDGSEAGKTPESVRSLYEQLSDMEMSVQDLLVAFGGGSVIDVTAFAAATYLGGLDYVQVPTSLLAMADSAASPVCRLNYRSTKNLLSLACRPAGVLIDADLLKTLPPRLMTNGYAQIIQFGCVQNPAILEMMETNSLDIEELLTAALAARIRLLADFPEGLNFGRPIGDAIEGHFRFLKYLHGEALALGMLAASPSDRLRRLLGQYKLPVHLEGVNSET